MEKRRSPWIAIILAVVIGVMVIVLLNGVHSPDHGHGRQSGDRSRYAPDGRPAGTAHDPIAGPAAGCL